MRDVRARVRGLPLSGVCPECGTAVATSLHAYSLRWASAEHLAALARVLAIEIAARARVASVVGMWFFGGFFLRGKGEEAVGWLVSMGVAMVFVVGWWWMTTPDLRQTAGDACSPQGEWHEARRARCVSRGVGLG